VSDKPRCGSYPKKFFKTLYGDFFERHPQLVLQLRFRKHPLGHVWHEVYWDLTHLEERWCHIEEMNNEDHDVEFSVAPRVSHYSKRKKENSMRALPEPPRFSCLWADIDVGDKATAQFETPKAAARHLIKRKLQPTILVSSGSGLHAYYCLNRFTSKTSSHRWKQCLESLASKLHGEAGSAIEPTRFMRVPNTVNWNNEKQTSYSITGGGAFSRERLKKWLNPDNVEVNKAHEKSGADQVEDGFKYLRAFRHLRGFRWDGNSEWCNFRCPNSERHSHGDAKPSCRGNLKHGGCKCMVCGWKGEISRLVGPALLAKDGGGQQVELPYYDFNQLIHADFGKEGDYLITPLIPRGSAVLSYGLPKGLKSWFSTAVAIDAAIGGKVLDYFGCPKAIRVLLVQVEDPAPRTKKRLKRLKESRPDGERPKFDMLKIVTRCPLNLMDEKWYDAIEEKIKSQKPELVIFDVFRRIFRGNINDWEQTAAFFERVDIFREKYGVTLWIVHHANKKEGMEIETRAAGSINLTGWGDVLIFFRGKRESKKEGSTECDIEITTKDETFEDLKVVLQDDAEPLLRVERVKEGNLELAQARGMLGHNWGAKDLRDVLDCKYWKAVQLIKTWLEANEIEKVATEGKSHKAVYRFLTREPQEEIQSG